MKKIEKYVENIKPTWVYILEYTPKGIVLHGKHTFMRQYLAKSYCKRMEIDLKIIKIVKGRILKQMVNDGVKIKLKTGYGKGSNWKKYDYNPDMYGGNQEAKSFRTKLRRHIRRGKITEIKVRKSKARKAKREARKKG